MTETSLQKSRPAKARAEAVLNAGRVARDAIGDLMTCASAAALSPLAMGCLVVLAKHSCGRESLEEQGSAMHLKDAQTVLAMKGMGFGDSDLVLSALGMAGLVRIENGVLTIPLLDGAIQSASIQLANRVAGWSKRTAPAQPRPSARLISMPLAPRLEVAPAMEALPLAPAAPTEVGAALPQPAEDVGPVKPAATRRAASTDMVRRFTSGDKVRTDPATDPVVARIPLDGDRVAEITLDYQRSLEATFGARVDIVLQLKLATAWSNSNPTKRKTFNGLRRFLNSWMVNALQSSSMQQQVVAANSQRNGFGQGGAYKASPDAAAPQETLASAEDEFADLLDPAADVPAAPAAPSTVVTAAIATPQPDAQGSFDDLFSAPADEVCPQSEPEVRHAAPRSGMSSKVLAARAGLGLNRPRPHHLSQR